MSDNKKLLSQWDIWLRGHKNSHYIQSEKYRFYHRLTGIPLVIISAAVNAGIWLVIGNAFPAYEFHFNIIVAIFALFVSCLAGVQAFSGFDRKSEQHRNAAIKYSALNGQVEVLLARIDTVTEADIKQVSEEWSLITDFAPAIYKKKS